MQIPENNEQLNGGEPPETDAAERTEEPLTDGGISEPEEGGGASVTEGPAEVEPPKKRKYGWIGTVLLIAVIAFGVYMMFQIVASMGKEVKSFGDVIAASDWRFALISLAAILAVFICLGLQYCVVIKTTTGKLHLLTGFKVAFTGKFYDNITPFATGGQPMQIYYLNKKGFHGGISSAIVLIRYFAWMFCWLLFSIVLMASMTGVLESQEQSSKLLLLIAGWIGLVINMFIPTVLILFVVLPKFSRGVTTLIIKAGCKIRIVKDRERAMERVEKIVYDFRSSFAIMSRSPVKFILLILLCFIEIFLTYAFPYFIMKMFAGLGDGDGIAVMFSVMALNIYATMSASVVPTPGNSGAIEGLVTAAFSSLAGSVLLWTVFGWRFGVYYVYIIIGLVITVVQFIKRLIKRKRSGGK